MNPVDCSHCDSCTCRSHDSGSSASSVDLKLTHLDWDAESALIHFQGQYLSTCEADYCALTAEIQRFPKTHDAVDVGEICLVEDRDSAQWFRGRVQNREESSYDVLLIDEGNVVTVDVSRISSCPEELLTLPPKLICGFLADVLLFQSCCQSSVDEFFSNLIGRNLTGFVHGTLPHHVVLLEAPDINRDLDRSTDPEPPEEPSFEARPLPLPKGAEFDGTVMCDLLSQTLAEEKIRGSSAFEGYVQFAKDPENFWVVSASGRDDTAPALEELMLEIQQYYAKHTVPLQPGDRCCVVRSPLDDRWYRGAVAEQRTGAFRVMLVDWGPTLQVTADRLQGLKQEFVGLEGQAFRCSLNRPLSRGGPDGADLLRTFVLDGPEHLECQLVYGSEPTAAVRPVSSESFVYSAFGLSAGNRERVYVTHVSSQREFYCQLGKNTGAMKELDRVTTVLCESGQLSGWDGVQKKPCLAKYVDGKWYRCSVLRAAAPPYVFVFFVDYGNTFICEKNNIAAIPAACRCLLDTPMQALKCNLVAVSNRPLCADAKDWLMDAALDSGWQGEDLCSAGGASAPAQAERGVLAAARQHLHR
uniref:Tudor domain-containing protein n=1 Tax=Oryzias sinensis TaxID=183150 RepID=A0A8C7XB13_9TELE